MKIIDILNTNKQSLSFEVFPPKTSDKYEVVSEAVKEIAKLSPSYMSVTYGAGGGTSEYTAKIASELSSLGVESLAHLTCITSTKEEIDSQISNFASKGIQNILALRGDIPEGFDRSKMQFHYAYELIDHIHKSGDFCIGGACYPESHPESESPQKDIEYLKLKISHGCQFLTTQMFFDNDIYYRFADILSCNGIYVPIVAGIMPITSYSQIDRMVKISGNELPARFVNMIEKYRYDPASLKEAGIEYATAQAREIYEHGYSAVHIYSMNKPEVAQKIQDNLQSYLI